MTRLLPYLLLPLGVALLEYHGIQFWTVAVTGAWPGWAAWGFVEAWHAWTIPVVLRLGALWCWAESRAEGWNGGLWTFSGGVLTIAVCISVLLNVVAPTQTNQAVVQALDDQRSRLDAREDANKDTVRRAVNPKTGVPYSRPLDELYRTQARSVDLFNEYMALAKAGKITTEAHGRLTLWLLVACVILVELLVVAAARRMGQPKSEQPAADFTDETGEPGAVIKAWQKIHAWRLKFNAEVAERQANPLKRGDMDIVNDRAWDGEQWVDGNSPEYKAMMAEANANRQSVDDIPRRGEFIVTGGYNGRERRNWATRPEVKLGEWNPHEKRPFSSRPEGVEDAAHPGAGSGQAGATAEHAESPNMGHNPKGSGSVVGPLRGHIYGGAATETIVPAQEIGESEPAPEAEEPEATRRVKAARARIEALWPMENQQQRADYLKLGPSGERDMSLLMHHERLAEEKKTRRHTKVISENALRRIEIALDMYGPWRDIPSAKPARTSLKPMELV